jgi:hypothetical protein
MRVNAGFSRLLRLDGIWVRGVIFNTDRVVVTVALRRRSARERRSREHSLGAGREQARSNPRRRPPRRSTWERTMRRACPQLCQSAWKEKLQPSFARSSSRVRASFVIKSHAPTPRRA